MKTYGKFEALKELYQTPTGSVWSACPVGSGAKANCCIKLIGGETAMFGPVDATAAKAFLAGAALQQKVAADAEAWAPIYDFGPDPSAGRIGDESGGAYYVTRLYPRSVQRLIDTRASVSATELRAILQGVVKGLIEMRAASGRSHGNLKPANVLLGDQPGRRAAAVVLTDPDPFPHPGASLTKLPDVKAMGALLFSLVTARPYMTARWPVPMSADWDRLGSSGPQWLQLCNNLLNTRGPADELSLDMIASRVEAIRPTRRRLARRWVAAAAVVIIAACAVVDRRQRLPYLQRDRWSQFPHDATVKLATMERLAVALISPPHKHRAPPAPYLDGPFVLKPRPTSRPVVATILPPPSPTVPSAASPSPSPSPPVASSATPAPVERPRRTPAIAPIAAARAAPPPAVAATPSPIPQSAPPPATAPGVALAPTHPVLVQVLPPPQPVAVPAPPPAPPPDPDAAARRLWIEQVRSDPPPAGLAPAVESAFEHMRSEFLAGLDQSHEPLATLQQRWAEALARVRQLDALFPPVPAPDAQQPWQIKLANLALRRRDQDAAAAVVGADGDAVVGARYRNFLATLQRLFADGGDADRALAGGDVPADNGTAAAAALAALDADLEARAVAAPLGAELAQLASIRETDDRARLLNIVTERGGVPGVRVAAWQRLQAPALAPRSLGELADRRAAAAALSDMLDGLGNPAGKLNVEAAMRRGQDAFFAGLTSPAAVTDAVAADASAPAIVPATQCPAWFQYDLVLWRMQHGEPARQADVDALVVLAAELDDASAHHLAAALAAPPAPRAGADAFDHAGPGGVGWTLRSHRGAVPYDSVTYLPPVRDESQDQALEFLRVGAAGATHAACYLCTTNVSVSRLQQLIGPDVRQVRALRSLGPADPSDGANPGVHVWTYSDDGDAIVLDQGSYRSYFHRAPTASLPAQFLTPQMAVYVARLLGCRLASPAEWRAALNHASQSADPATQGFATQGWKLRDALFERMARRNAADADAPPLDDGIFPAPAGTSSAGIWTAARVKLLGGLGGRTLAETPDSLTFDGADELTDNESAALRPVGALAGVFHDLVGNVAELVMDGDGVPVEPPTLAASAGPQAAAAAVRDWFSPQRLGEVRVVGGSALSPPSIDPLQPMALPAGGKLAFADVGFRLAFTDPTVPRDTVDQSIAAAPLLTAKPVGVADTPP